MAGMEKHDESFQQISEEQVIAIAAVNNDQIPSENPMVVTSMENAENTNEILLYVDGNQDVQDLIRVALNQGISSADLQQQLQEAGANITLQNIGDRGIVSMGNESEIQQVQSTSLMNIVGEMDHHQQQGGEVGDVKDTGTSGMNNLFHLANLSGTLSSEIKAEVVGHENMQEFKDENSEKSEIGVAETSVVESDFIISNIDAEEQERVPGEFEVGDSFYSLEEVEEALRQYEDKHNVKLYKRDVRSLEALLKRSLKLQKLDKINESLKYGQLLYCCVYGGKRKAQKIACMDERGIARYTDCRMFIRFAISDDGMQLVVNGKLEQHNHIEVESDEQNTEPLYITNAGNAEEIRLGAGFVDLEELYKAVHKYETDNHVHLWRRDGRTVEALAKRAPGTAKKILETNPGLRFAELRFCCSYGGRQIADNSKDKIRGAPNSFKQGCEMHIRFGVSDDGSQLVVKSMSEEHNHEINEESIVKEALHPDLISYVSKLVWSDVNIGIDEVKKQLEHYVINEMFRDQVSPPRTRRQYFPSKKQIRYFMVKAKASLNISQETEFKLAAQAEKLKESHGDEKMVFNFKVKQHEINPMDLGVNSEESVADGEEELITDPQNDTGVQDGAKVLFCHQTPHQQRLLKRYSSHVILTQISDIHSKIPFPLYCLYVQTNVDYQLVGEFILQVNTSDMIAEGLQTIKDWNPGWNPKFVIVDYFEEQISAVESAFPGVFLLISDESRERAWSDWLNSEENGVCEHQEEVMRYLQAIATSYSEDTLNTAARELEESDVWKMSDKMRNWFQLHWLAQAKRWVAGYRPDDFLLTHHNGRSLQDEMKVFKSIKLVTKSTPLQDVIQQLVEHVVPVAKKQYEMLNQESFKLQNELFYLYPDIPNYLSCRPGKLTYHIYERIKSASEQSYIISYLHPGIFSVQGTSEEDDILHTVSFGDSNSFPSCDCIDWQQFKLPCCHLCAVFSNYPGWTWDMLSISYKSSPSLSVDWAAIPDDDAREVPGFKIDNGTQTTSGTLLGSEFAKVNRIGELMKSTETSQVLASQCRGLLQQLSKLQLAHHSREKLYRLKSELKELISIFSNTPKPKYPSSSPWSIGSHVIQTKGPGRPRKVNMPASPIGSHQTVFEQYNVKPITPRQVTTATGERKIINTRSMSSAEITNANSTITQAKILNEKVNLGSKTVYIIDPTQVLASTKPVNETNTGMKTEHYSRKREGSLTPEFTEPDTKRVKEGETTVNHTEKVQDDLQRNVSLEFPEDPGPTPLLSVNNESSVSAIIDGQTINIPLDISRVSVAMVEGLSEAPTPLSLAGGLEPETFVTAADNYQGTSDTIDSNSAANSEVK